MKRIWNEEIPSNKFRRRRYHKFSEITNRFFNRQKSNLNSKTSGINRRQRSTLFIEILMRFVPILQWLPHYRWRDSFFSDLSAGLTMAVFSVPTGIAHAGICGVAPVYGLYTAIFPSFSYLLFGNSRHNALGGFAILSLMTRAAIEKVYRLTQHVQLLHTSNSAAQTNTTTTTTIATTISQISTTIATLAISGTILTNSTNLNTNLNTTFNDMPNQLYDNSTDAFVVKILETNSNDSDSMVFGLNSKTNINNKLSLEKNNPFFKDTIGAADEQSNTIIPSDFIDGGVSSKTIDGETNLTMLILKGSGTDKAAAILFNSGVNLSSAPAAAALVAAASKVAAAENSVVGLHATDSQKKKIILDAASIAAAAAAPSKTKNNENLLSTNFNSAVDLKNIRPINVATIILFLSGIMQILLGIFRLDFLHCYLSEQIMSGFVLGGCVHVFFSQIGDVLGITLPTRSGRGYLYIRFNDLISCLNEIHKPTALISSCSISFLLFSQKILNPWLSSVFQFPIPYELILVIIGITATNFAQLSKRHSITVVGNVPTNFPTPSLPRYDLISFIFFDAISITIIAVAIHLTIVKIVENRYHYKINSCQELYSLGLTSLCASMFPVFPVTSIFARAFIGDVDKNSTHMTIFFSSMGLLAVILYIGPALEYLPKCILASMVVVSLSASFSKFNELRSLWPLFKFDFVIFLVSFMLTVCYDMAEGLTFTVIFAIFTIVIRDQWPRWHFLSHDEDSNEFKETPKQHINELNGNACVLRYDAPLIFPNVQKFLKVVEQGVKQWERRQINTNSLKLNHSNSLINKSAEIVKKYHKNGINITNTTKNNITLIIDCSGFPYVDYLGLCTLKRVYKDFAEKNVTVKFAAPKAILMQMFQGTDFKKTVPENNIYATVRHAVQSTL